MVLDRLEVHAVIIDGALAGTGVPGGLIGAVVLAGLGDAVALHVSCGLGGGDGLGHRDGAGKGARGGKQSCLVHREVLTFC